MVTKGILFALHGLAATLLGWMHDALPSPPSFWSDATDAVTTVVGSVPGPLMWLVPVGPVLTAAGSVLALIVLLGTLRLARRVLSLFTGGGGMA